MNLIKKSSLSLIVASISTAMLISACQPKSADDTAAVTTDAPEAVATEDPHAGHDMSGGDMTTMPVDDANMSPMLKDYTASMTTMHEEMMKGMSFNNPDTAFAQGMLGHHIGAVAMAKVQLKYGKDAEMLQLAQNIIDAQQAEITQMQSWLASHPDATEPAPDTEAMQQAYAQGMDTMHSEMMQGITDPNPDMAFARGMLPHHVGAVDMAEVQLKYGKDEEMRKLAQQIIDAQQAEIKQMQNWISVNKA